METSDSRQRLVGALQGSLQQGNQAAVSSIRTNSCFMKKGRAGCMAGLGVPAMARGKRQPQGEMSLAPRLMHPATRMPAGGSVAVMGC